MSDSSGGGARDDAVEAAVLQARKWLERGRARDLAEQVLSELGGEASWRRETALRCLERLPATEALLDALLQALADDEHAGRRNAARSALAALAAPSAAEPATVLARLAGVLTAHRDPDVRVLAATALGESANPAARPPLEAALDAPHPNVVAACADALGQLGDVRAVDALLRGARSGEFWTRAAALSALGRLRDPRALPALADALRDPLLAGVAASALGTLGDPDGLEALRPLLEGTDPERGPALPAVAEILGRQPAARVPTWLRAALEGDEAALAAELTGAGDAGTARLLGVVGSVGAARLLAGALSSPRLCEAAAAGLALVPPASAGAAILERLPDAAPRERLLLLTALPPLGDAGAARQVARHLGDRDPEVRAAAADALARSGPALALPLLEELQRAAAARPGVALAYGRLQPPACEPLLHLLGDGDPLVRAAAAEGLARCRAANVGELAAALRREDDPATREALARALGTLGGEAAAQALAPWLDIGDLALRFTVVRALGCTGAAAALPVLLRALDAPEPELQAAALHALGELGDRRAEGPVAGALHHPDRDVRRTAMGALERLAPASAVDRLHRALEDPDREVRLLAVRILRQLGGSAQLPALERAADSDPDAAVRRLAARALVDLQSGDHP